MLTKKRLFKFLRLLALVLIGLPCLWITAKLIRNNNNLFWLPNYMKDVVSGQYAHSDVTKHMFVLICDHWEPGNREGNILAAKAWLAAFKPIVASHQDSHGRYFKYTWFYPIDNFEPDIFNLLSQAVYEKYGEVEVHWHHYHESSVTFEKDLKNSLSKFTAYGALISEFGDKPHFAFIHGNWALDNSGSPGNCGVNDEISILLRNGCYADLTFPALGFRSQPKIINRIFYAVDSPEPKSYDHGEIAKIGVDGVGLMIIQGPLGIDFKNLLILFENAALNDAEGTGFSGHIRKPSNFHEYFKRHRVHLWNQIGISIQDRREWVFVKLHTHGMQNQHILLGGELDAALYAIEDYCRLNDIFLHYIVAREAFNLVKAAEKGLTGDPEQY